jgi:hypothetical protein
VQAVRSALQSFARFVNNGGSQLRHYSATARIRPGGRLTGFGFARNIIRIRTIRSVVTDEPHPFGADLQAFTW